MLRIAIVQPIEGFRLRLTLIDGSAVEKDVAPYLVGPVFAQKSVKIRNFSAKCISNAALWCGPATSICARTS